MITIANGTRGTRLTTFFRHPSSLLDRDVMKWATFYVSRLSTTDDHLACFDVKSDKMRVKSEGGLPI